MHKQNCGFITSKNLTIYFRYIYREGIPLFNMYIKIALLVLVTLISASCATTDNTISEVQVRQPLLVGITPNYPPVIFKRNDGIVGVEADLARRLADELDRTVRFVELSWEDQISALLDGRIDIIMSGMSVTMARKVRINFSDHYLTSGLVAMMHAEDVREYSTINDIKQGLLQIGVVEGTTSDEFVRKNFPAAVRIASFKNASDAVMPLKNRSIDIFVHDAPSIIWLVSENEADLTALWEPLNMEYLAWGVRKDDQELLIKINSILDKWKKDGTLNSILLRWLPSQYLERFK